MDSKDFSEASDHSIPKNINIKGRKSNLSSFIGKIHKLRLSNLLKEFKKLLEEGQLEEAGKIIYFVRKEAFHLRLMKTYRLAQTYESELAKKEAIKRRASGKPEFEVRPYLTHPRLLHKTNSFFYKEQDRDAKFFTTMTIFLALKKDFRIPDEEDSDEIIWDDSFNNRWEREKFHDLLAKRVRFLLISIGFEYRDIPTFQYIRDDFENEEEVELTLHKDLVGNYHFMIIEGYPIYRVWKLCDFLYSNRIRRRGGLRYISYEDIVEKPKRLVEDKLFFLYSFFGENC